MRAAALTHLTLSVPRDTLPPPDDEDEFLPRRPDRAAQRDGGGRTRRHEAAIQDFGAGDKHDIRPPKGPHLTLGFTKANVPVVDVAGGRLVVVLPDVVEVLGG